MESEQQREVKFGERSGWIRIENPPVDAVQRKLFNLLLHFHLQTAEADGRHSVPIETINLYVDFSGRVETQLLLACERLSQTVVHWELRDEHGGHEMGFAALLPQAWCDGGQLYFSLAPRLSDLLHDDKAFGLIHLDVRGLFTGRHTGALYDLLRPLARVETRGWMELDEFRRRMRLDRGADVPRFSDLRRRVIEPALSEINALSGLSAAVEYRREGRRVTGVKFRVTRKNDPSPTECLYLPAADPEKMDRAHALEQEFEAYKAGRVCEIVTTLSGDEADRLLAAFVKSIEDNGVLMKKYEKDGLDNLSVRLRYEAFLERMLLPEEEADFRRFVEKKRRSSAVDR
jgi:hypothetical protein